MLGATAMKWTGIASVIIVILIIVIMAAQEWGIL